MDPKYLMKLDKLFVKIPYKIERSFEGVSFIIEPKIKIGYILIHCKFFQQSTIHQMTKVCIEQLNQAFEYC